MKACKVDEGQLAEWIDGSTGAIRYLGPAITDGLAQKILAAEKRTGQRNRILIELDDEVDRSGYGQTAGVRVLHNQHVAIQHRNGLRVAALTAPGVGVVWSPIAERIDPIDRVSVNGIWMEGAELGELQRWMSRMMGEQPPCVGLPDGQEARGPAVTAIGEGGVSDDSALEPIHPSLVPDEPEVLVHAVDEGRLKTVEINLEEHPPRDFKEEKQAEVYQGYVGFIEIHVTGASLSGTTTLAIPKELTELGLEDDLRNRLSERMRIDLSGNVDLGARDVNKRVDAFREIFTRQMGPPLGRIYKKSDWPVMQTKWVEIEALVEEANEKIKRSMHAAVEKVLRTAARDWGKAINDANLGARLDYLFAGEHEIYRLLSEQWDRKQRATRMKVQMFVKDLTWATLNNQEVRRKIEEAYPELCATGLFKSRRAWAS